MKLLYAALGGALALSGLGLLPDPVATPAAVSAPAGAVARHVTSHEADPASMASVRSMAAPPLAQHSAQEPKSVVADLCGLGRMVWPAGADSGGIDSSLMGLPAPIGKEPLDHARDRMLEALQADGTTRSLVAAQLLARPVGSDASSMRTWAHATLQMALAHPDPVALAWAEEACGWISEDGSQGPGCRVQLIRARIRSEPLNGWHWAALGEEDPSLSDEAWAGLLRAKEWREFPDALTHAAAEAVPAGTPGYVRLALAAQVSQLVAGQSSPGEEFLSRHCSDGVHGRATECRTVAALLAEQGDGTRALALGLQVGRASGWSAARQTEVQDELAQLASSTVGWQVDPASPLACHGVEGWREYLQQLAQVGELTALRHRLGRAQSRR